jgi:hypothetical protein
VPVVPGDDPSGRELSSLREDLDALRDAEGRLREEVVYHTDRAEREAAKVVEANTRTAEAERNAKYWAKKYNELRQAQRVGKAKSSSSTGVKKKKKIPSTLRSARGTAAGATGAKRPPKLGSSSSTSALGAPSPSRPRAASGGDSDDVGGGDDNNDDSDDSDGQGEVLGGDVGAGGGDTDTAFVEELQRDRDSSRAEAERAAKQLAAQLELAREADEIMSLMRDAHEEQAEEADRLAEERDALRLQLTGTRTASEEFAAEIERLRRILDDNNIKHQRDALGNMRNVAEMERKHAEMLAAERRSRDKLASELDATDAQRRRLAEEAEQRTILDVAAIDLEVQHSDLALLENDLYLLQQFKDAGNGDTEREHQVSRLRANLRSLTEHLTQLKEIMSQRMWNPQDEERAAQLRSRIDAMSDAVSVIGIGLF